MSAIQEINCTNCLNYRSNYKKYPHSEPIEYFCSITGRSIKNAPKRVCFDYTPDGESI